MGTFQNIAPSLHKINMCIILLCFKHTYPGLKLEIYNNICPLKVWLINEKHQLTFKVGIILDFILIKFDFG